MGKRGFLLGSAIALSALGVAILGTAVQAGATSAPDTITIGVDNASPAGHNFQYVDFFPRGLPLGEGVSPTVIQDGTTVDFAWNSGSKDGFHTATLLKQGVAPGPATWGADHPPVAPDTDDGAGQLEENPAILAPGPDPSCGHSPTNPCQYGGSHEINSGAMPTSSGAHFFVRVFLDSGTTTTIHFVCLIHPGMQGALTVAPGLANEVQPTSTATLATAAATQYASDTAEATAAENLANTKAVANNGDGTHTITMTAGTASQHVEVLEMLPNRVEARPGDKVKWVTTTRADIHTVTFPLGHGSDGVDPLPFVCEGPGATDTPAAGPPPGFGCSSPAAFEAHFVPGPSGPTAIESATTVATSGIIASQQTPFPQSYTFSFPNTGSYAYQCRVHDNMVGTVVVNAAQAVNAPPTTTPPQLAQTGGKRPLPWLPVGLGLLLLLSGLGIRAQARGGDLTG